ncbi:MAG TPA: hypothetical protein VHW23_04505 [Kofleriaceae bacterium]|nr:hypothetical protein [Kofleriaceae bacterium]
MTWYPDGKGGPLTAGGPPANAPVLIYSNSGAAVTAWGDQLTVGAPTPAGTFVVAIVERLGFPGASESIGVLIPDVAVNGAAVAVHTVGVLASHREVSDLHTGQIETYTEASLKGTANHVVFPL